jgi:hypothetical protein
MSIVINSLGQIPRLMAAPRSIALLFVEWSPGPYRSRVVLNNLEASRNEWSPKHAIEFFEIVPEAQDELNRWYEELCRLYSPRFELHGHGWGPLWWVANGEVLDCLTKPYELPLETSIQRSVNVLLSGAHA